MKTNKWSNISDSWLYRALRSSIYIFLIFTFFLLAPGKGDVYGGDAKYIVLFVADGWGQKSIEATNSYTGTTPDYQYSPWNEHWVSTYPSGGSYNSASAWSDFSYVMSNYGDSSSCATALYTGQKTANGRVSVSSDATTAFFSIGERAKEYGMAVGAISSVPISHATPGTWMAHNDDRSNTYAIADEGLFGDPNATGTTSTDWKYGGGHGPTDPPAEVIIGTDGLGYVSTEQLDRLRTESGQPGAHVLVEWQSGQNAATNLMAEANDSSTTKLVGLFNHFYHNADGSGFTGESPSLSESTTAALKILNRNPNGFVLMVEGGAIDWAAHANNLNQLIGEHKDFDAAIQTVTDWVNDVSNGSDWTNTLVIVTGDHDCGYLTSDFGVFPNNPSTGDNIPLGTINDTTLGKEKVVTDTGGRRASWEDADFDSVIDSGETVYWYWHSPNHTNALIPLYARGTGSSLFTSYETGTDSVRGPYLDDISVFSVMDSSIMNQTCTATGTLSVIPGQALYDSPIDVSSLLLSYNATSLNFEVLEPGAACVEQIDESIITKVDTWKYNGDNLGDIGTTWKDTLYDDSSWSSGDGIFGYGETYVNTTIGAAGQMSEYFRTTFDICDATEVTSLSFNVTYDDAVVVYINGIQVWALNVEGDPPAWDIGVVPFPGHESNNGVDTGTPVYNLYNLDAHIDKLVNGTNVIAIGVYNSDNSSSDMVFDGEFIISHNSVDTSLFSGNYSQAQSVVTTTWSDGDKTLQVTGDDTTCLTPLTVANDTFLFNNTPLNADTVLISNNTAIAATNPVDGELDILMQRFQLDSNVGINAGNGEVILESLSLSDEGTATNISNTEVHISTTNSATLPLDAVLIGETGPWNGQAQLLSLTGGTAADRTVTNGTPKYIYIVYDLAPSQAGNTINASVSTVFVETPDISAGNVGTSNTLTIQACVETGSIAIQPLQTVYGNPIDLTTIVDLSNTENVTYTITQVATCNVDPNGTYIESENFTGTLIPESGTGTFELQAAVSPFLGSGYLKSTGVSNEPAIECPGVGGETINEGKEYRINFPTAGTYILWARAYSQENVGDPVDEYDSIFYGLDGDCNGVLMSYDLDMWSWSKNKKSGGFATITISTPGIHTINIWVRENNFLIDGIYVTQGAETPTDGAHGLEVDPTACTTPLFVGDETEAQSIITTSWVDGTQNLEVTGDDATCHTALTTATDTFSFDQNNPPVSAILDPTEMQLMTDGSPNPYTISGTASDEESINHIEVSTDNGQSWQTANCPACPSADISAGDPWTYSWSLPANGIHTIMSRAVDNRGLTGYPSTGINIDVQLGGPVVLITIPADTDTAVVSDTTVTINWDKNVDCATVDASSVTISPAVGWSKTSCVDAQAVFTPSGQTDLTTYTVTVTTAVTDSVSNAMAADYVFSYDTGEPVAPSSAISNPTDGGKINSSASDPYEVSGTATDNDKVQGVEVRIDGGSWVPVTSCTNCNTSSATWTYDWNLPADGFYTIESRATDASNNVETPSAPIDVEVDRTSPSISTTSPVNGSDGLALDLQVTLTWNENVNCATVNTTNITSNNPAWTLFGCGGNTAFFTTTGQAEYTPYTVTVSTAVTNVGGTPMSDPYVLSYTTNKTPTLSIQEPSASDSVKAGEALDVIYTLDDPDHDITVNFFYETDGNMQDGLPVPGACTGAAEGTSATCTWNIDAGFTPDDYYIYGVTNDGYGVEKAISGLFTIYPPNQAPILSIAEPNGNNDTVVDGDTYAITYNLTDANVDDDIFVDFFYDVDDQDYNGTPISGSCSSAPEGSGATCGWNTVGLSPGAFYIYGITSGDAAGPVQAYSSGQVTINEFNTIPTFNISTPELAGVTITEGDVYSITYDLEDIDDDVTVALHYDDNGSGLNGTPIGSCATAAEGTGLTCDWNTSGMSAGSYYIYGITNGDRDSTIIARYSPGEITINVNAPAVDTTTPADTTTGVAPDSVVTINWDENVNCATVDATSVTISPAVGWSKTSCLDAQAVFTPTGQLNATSYQITVSTAVEDTEGFGMTANHVFSYTTNEVPILVISEPIGSEGAQTISNSFDIKYTLSDGDHTVTAALYYDVDTNNLNGIGDPIPGCGAVDEGIDSTCSWNNLPSGSYYIYGVTDDGVGGNSCDTRTWDGINNAFLTDSNWSPTGVPQDGDDVILNAMSTFDSLWGTDVSLTSLSMNAGYSGTATIDSSVSISGDLIISDGAMIINGDVTVGDTPVSCGGGGSEVWDYSGLITIAPAGITVNPNSGLGTDEDGGTDSFDVVLDTAPAADVTVSIASLDTGEGTVDKSLLTFTTSDWFTPQTVTVTGQDDSLDDGDVAYIIQTIAASVGDANYDSLAIDDVAVTNYDNDAAVVNWTTASQNALENVGTMTVTAELNVPSVLAVDVPFIVTGTASDPADYTITETSPISISAGSTTASITINVVDDGLNELNETVIITMGAPTNAAQGATSVHTATIDNDNGLPEVNWTAASQSNDESVTAVTVTATLDVTSGLDVTVPFTLGGDAADPADYSVTGVNPIIITAGNLTASTTVTVVDDAIDENDETVVLTMGTVINAGKGLTDVHTATITDNDDAPEVNWTAASQSNDESVTTLTVTATLDTTSGLDVTIPFTLGGDAVDPADYFITGVNPIIITAGNLTSSTTITVVDDAIDENDETVVLTMGVVINAVKGLTDVHTATILDNDDAPTVTFTSASQSSVNETGAMTITAELSATSGLDVDVPFSIDGLSAAVDPDDYSITATPVTIAAGSTTADITITIVGDTLNEGDETVIVNMGTPVNATQGATISHTATITDDDGLPTVTFTSASQASIDETGAMTITAELSATSGLDVDVPFSIGGLSAAIDPDDYTISASPATITAGTTTVDITITIAGDALDENDETVIVNMGTPVNATQGATTAHTATITDDDSLPSVTFTSTSQASIDETGAMTITAQLSTASGRDVDVPFSIDGLSTAGDPADYSISASPATISAGSTTADIIITIAGDASDENNETVIVNMGTPVNATQGGTTAHTATITDDDDAPTVTFTSASQSSGAETGAMTITAQLSAPSSFSVDVPFSIDGLSTAVDPADYSISASPATIAAGSTTADITITIAGDTLDEINETVIVNMGTPVNATQGAITSHTATITDDDAAPTVNWTSSGQSTQENGAGIMTVTAWINATSGLDVEIPFTVTGTASEPADFTINSSPITIPAGSSFAQITISIVNDTLNELDETIIVTMGTPTNGIKGVMDVNTTTIEDDEGAPIVNWTAASQSNDESVTTVTVTASLSGISGLDVDVPFSLGGTAVDPADYAVTGANPITITAGTLTASTTITIVNDVLDEDDETVILTMGTVTNSIKGATDVHTATITDNDATPSVTFTSVSQASAGENGAMTITAQLSAVAGRNVTVPFSIDGLSSAIDPDDYTISPSPLVITAGLTTADITITIAVDTLNENNETVIVNMGSPTNATQGATTSHTATITDDDAIPTVTFTSPSQASAGESSTMIITAQLSVASSFDVDVPFTIGGLSTAIDPDDYSISASPATITAGSTTVDITITIAADTLDENNETVIVDMGTPGNATQGATTSHTATITDDDAIPTVTFTAASQASVNESGDMIITAQLSTASSFNVTVPFSIDGLSTAIDPDDYSVNASPIVITAGSTAATITITIAGDLLDEFDETVIVKMGTPVNATLGATTLHTATITDDDATPTVTFTASSQASAGESSTMTITAQLSAVGGRDVTVPYSVDGLSTAANPADYSITTPPLNISAGSLSADITITIAVDTLDEDNETVIVNMGSPTNAAQGATTTHTATITDDDATPSVSFTAASQASAGESGDMTITAQLSAASGYDVTVPFSIGGLSTAGDPADYSITATPVIISAGSTTTTITISIAVDTLNEGDETVIVDMGIPVNASQGATTSHTATITDDDATPSVTFTSASQASAGESGDMTITAQLSAASGFDVTVPFSINGLSAALDPDDYSITATPVIISAGSTSVDITITIAADALDEDNETVIVNMGSPVNAIQGATTSHTATITDDDATPSVAFTSPSQASVGESGIMTITAEISAVGGRDVTVPYTLNVASTATDTTDFTLIPVPLTISAGSTTADITLTIAVDSLDEDNETVIVDMGTPTNATQGATTTHTATITDDDATPTVTFTSASQSSVGETGAMIITAQISAVGGRDVTVPYSVNVASTAGDPDDYSVTVSPLIIAAGSTSADITITIATDTLDENNETVIVDMGTPVNAAQGATTTHTATITDDDATPSVTFTATSQASAGESSAMTITAQLSAASSFGVSVPFSVDVLSTAGDPTDYSIDASPIAIAAGTTTGTITITIASDTLDENDETVIVNMGSPTNATQGATTTHTATITDDDATPSVTFTAASQSSGTENGTMTITAQLSAVGGLDVTVPYSVNVASTATDTTDFTLVPVPLTISAGSTTADITLTIVGDTLDENNETVIVDMGAPTNATQGATTTHTATITDDDATPSVTFTSASQASAGESSTMTITAQLSAASSFNVDVPFSVDAASTATDTDDYTITASPVSITAGSTSVDITITIAGDALDENNETVIVNMGTPTNASQGAITTHTATITDDDATPTINWTTSSQVGTEGGFPLMWVTAVLSAESGLDVTLPYILTGSATLTDDFTITSSPLTITAGQTSVTATITIVDDSESGEGAETVIVTMDTPTNANTGVTDVHTATINDND